MFRRDRPVHDRSVPFIAWLAAGGSGVTSAFSVTFCVPTSTPASLLVSKTGLDGTASSVLQRQDRTTELNYVHSNLWAA